MAYSCLLGGKTQWSGLLIMDKFDRLMARCREIFPGLVYFAGRLGTDTFVYGGYFAPQWLITWNNDNRRHK
jgi:hypothetical protein